MNNPRVHSGRRGNHMVDVAFAVGLLGLLAELLLLSMVLVTQGADRANTWASLLGAVVAIVGTLAALVTWWLRQRAAARRHATADRLTRAAQELHAVVRDQWRKEVEARSLGDPDPMPVRWRLSEPEMMDHDRHIGAVPLGFSGCSDRIPEFVDQFRTLRRRRLVIIGASGSGKTTLAVQLLLQLLDGWQPTEPVPVLFSLASWNPNNQPRVQDWLAEQLNQTYPDLRAFGPDTAQQLADRGQLTPVLDGLDEIPAGRRGDVISALNASLHPQTGLILTSRATEYAETVRSRDVLTAAAVIEAEPLNACDAAAYLEDRLARHVNESWQAVLTALRNGAAGALAEVVASPLGLWLFRTVYIDGHGDPRPLIDFRRYPDAATIWHQLLENLIPAAVRSRPPRPGSNDQQRPIRHYDPDQVRRWLTTVAIELRDAQTRDWRWWQLARRTFTTPALVGGLLGVVGGVMGVLANVLTDVVIAMFDHQVAEFRRLLDLSELVGPMGREFGLVGLAIGLVGGLATGYSDVPAHTDLRIRGRARTLGAKLAIGMVAGLMFAALFVLLPMLLSVLKVAHFVFVTPVVLVVWGGVAGLGFTLISFAASPSIARRASSPTESQQGDKRLTVLISSIAGGGAGLVFLPTFVAVYDTPLTSRDIFDAGQGGLVFGLVYGLLGGPVMSRTCWLAFVVASMWLGARRRLPFRLMEFLDDAYRLGLLRIVGPVYQFRHAVLQDHLAPPNESLQATSDCRPTHGVRRPQVQ